MLRLVLVAAGIPERVCGYELLGVGFFDLAWPEYRLLVEYDGDEHRTSSKQYDRDITRFDLAADRDWRVIRVRVRGLYSGRDATIARVLAALTKGGWTPNGRNSG